MKKSTKRLFTHLLSLILVVSIIVTAFIPVFAAQAQGITSGSTYMLKNKASNKYLTVPRFTDTEKNVYQSTAKINDEYFRAVRVTYTAGRYILTPLIYETLGQGYIVSDSGDNVYCSTVSTNEAWSIEYVVGEGGYKITDRSGKALTAVGLSNGSVSDSSINAGGNIIVAEYSGADNQIWYFESVTVNPHMVKNELITKKNLGTGAEWLLCLSTSEMNSPNVSIVDIEVSRESLVTVQQFGKWLLVRMNEDTVTPNDATDDYAIIKISLNNGVQRLVIIQDAGTGSNDACRTLPINSYTEIHTVVLENEQPNDFMLTFRSNLGAVTILEWEIENYTESVEFANYEGRELTGTNYAVITVDKIGFAVVSATTVYGDKYSILIEIRSRNTDGTYRVSQDVKQVTENNKDFELQLFRNYLFRMDSLGNATSAWDLNIEDGNIYTHRAGNNYFILGYYDGDDRTISARLPGTGSDFVITVSQAEGAIIILPGMMGSQIFAGEDITINGVSLDEGTRLWDPDIKGIEILPSIEIEALHADEKTLALAMDDTGESVYETYVNAPVVNDYDNKDEGFQYGSMDIYRNVYNQLYEDCYEYGYDIILYEYDWRYDTYDISLQLDQYITSNGYKDVILVGHSLGGNLASYYISLGEAQRAKINKNISVVTPFLGSAKLLYAYSTGNILDDDILNDLANLIGFKEAITDVIYNIPSVYGLLPFEQSFVPYLEYTDANGNVVKVNTYDDTLTVLSDRILTWNYYLANKVTQNQSRLFLSGGKHITALVDSYYIVGNNLETITTLTYELGDNYYFSELLEVEKSLSGDNTVTLQSATANWILPADRVYYKNNTGNYIASHVDIIKAETDDSTLEFISALIDPDKMKQLSYYGLTQNLS